MPRWDRRMKRRTSYLPLLKLSIGLIQWIEFVCKPNFSNILSIWPQFHRQLSCDIFPSNLIKDTSGVTPWAIYRLEEAWRRWQRAHDPWDDILDTSREPNRYPYYVNVFHPLVKSCHLHWIIFIYKLSRSDNFRWSKIWEISYNHRIVNIHGRSRNPTASKFDIDFLFIWESAQWFYTSIR